MKSDIPEKVADTLRDIGMTPKQAGWNCHGTYVLLHKALEKVAVHRKIVFKEPTILECNSENWDVLIADISNLASDEYHFKFSKQVI